MLFNLLSLDLKYGELSMSLQQAYTALLTGQQALARYLVYAKLVKLGYRVSLIKNIMVQVWYDEMPRYG